MPCGPSRAPGCQGLPPVRPPSACPKCVPQVLSPKCCPPSAVPQVLSPECCPPSARPVCSSGLLASVACRSCSPRLLAPVACPGCLPRLLAPVARPGCSPKSSPQGARPKFSPQVLGSVAGRLLDPEKALGKQEGHPPTAGNPHWAAKRRPGAGVGRVSPTTSKGCEQESAAFVRVSNGAGSPFTLSRMHLVILSQLGLPGPCARTPIAQTAASSIRSGQRALALRSRNLRSTRARAVSLGPTLRVGGRGVASP
jgi:hypothetical protein